MFLQHHYRAVSVALQLSEYTLARSLARSAFSRAVHPAIITRQKLFPKMAMEFTGELNWGSLKGIALFSCCTILYLSKKVCPPCYSPIQLVLDVKLSDSWHGNWSSSVEAPGKLGFIKARWWNGVYCIHMGDGGVDVKRSSHCYTFATHFLQRFADITKSEAQWYSPLGGISVIL